MHTILKIIEIIITLMVLYLVYKIWKCKKNNEEVPQGLLVGVFFSCLLLSLLSIIYE
jgi:uncharacterized protein with PQ loop repeat